MVGRLVVPALVLLTSLLVVRAAAALARGSGSDVCVPPVQVGASCSTTSTTTASSRSTGTASSSSAGTTETQTSTAESSTVTTTETGGSTTTTTTTTTTTVTGGGGRTSGGPVATAPPASRFPPPPPPLPPASPGVAAAGEAVQRIVLVPAAPGPIAPGDTVEVQATLEAQRGTEIYAVPHVPVTFALLSSPGGGSSLTPARVTSDDTGVALVRVRTGDLPGDTVVSASSATASAQLGLHTEVRATGAAADVTAPASGTEPSAGGHTLVWIAGLLLAGVLGAAALSLGRWKRASGDG